jgi:hypothetical protein
VMGCGWDGSGWDGSVRSEVSENQNPCKYTYSARRPQPSTRAESGTARRVCVCVGGGGGPRVCMYLGLVKEGPEDGAGVVATPLDPHHHPRRVHDLDRRVARRRRRVLACAEQHRAIFINMGYSNTHNRTGCHVADRARLYVLAANSVYETKPHLPPLAHAAESILYSPKG